jgi:hypothetical protein
MDLPSITAESLISAATPRGELLLVRSILSFPQGTRVGLLDLERTKPRVLLDGMLADPEALTRVADHFGERLRVGLWDAMAATEWAVAWTTERPFELHRPNGKGFAQVDEELHRTGGGLSLVGDPTLQFVPLRLDAYVDPEWIHRGVRAFTKEGLEVPIHTMSDIEWMADPTYDALDLAMDAAWASLLAATMGECFGIPVEDTIR